jgi:hypothetical protein
VHTVDLDTGTGYSDLPPSFLSALLDDIAARRSAVGTSPALALTATDTGGSWQVKGNGDATDIEAPLATLAQWLSGRPVAGLTGVSGAPAPALPAWL